MSTLFNRTEPRQRVPQRRALPRRRQPVTMESTSCVKTARPTCCRGVTHPHSQTARCLPMLQTPLERPPPPRATPRVPTGSNLTASTTRSRTPSRASLRRRATRRLTRTLSPKTRPTRTAARQTTSRSPSSRTGGRGPKIRPCSAFAGAPCRRTARGSATWRSGRRPPTDMRRRLRSTSSKSPSCIRPTRASRCLPFRRAAFHRRRPKRKWKRCSLRASRRAPRRQRRRSSCRRWS
mmetsp:Transcript_2976/g.6179  ORF Transcript_2976/g.6179 Transcript_2976/m.6179 type:complete len:236 (-) Transcript_2976:177-884(-)